MALSICGLRINLGLDGSSVLRKVLILTVVMYYREKIQIKISKRKKLRGEIREKQASRYPLPVELHTGMLDSPSNDL